jgi:putative membrane protein
MSDEDWRATPPQPTNPNATRDHLANERTLLAWVRTCVAIVALGFVVARFGLVLRELGAATARHSSILLSTGLGVALVLSGAALVVLATLRYRVTQRAIDDNTYHPSPLLLMVVSGSFVVVAAVLALYLIVTA